MTDPRLIVAHYRADELLVALQSAVNGDAHWRLKAGTLLREINDLVVSEPATEALREADARKRAAEIMQDVCSDAD